MLQFYYIFSLFSIIFHFYLVLSSNKSKNFNELFDIKITEIIISVLYLHDIQNYIVRMET